MSRFSSIAATSPLEAALAMCSLYRSLLSITTPRTFTWFLGWTTWPLMVNGSTSALYALRVKWMMAVFSASNVAPLLLSQSSACLMMASIPSRVLCAVGPVTQAVKSSTKAIAPPLLSIFH